MSSKSKVATENTGGEEKFEAATATAEIPEKKTETEKRSQEKVAAAPKEDVVYIGPTITGVLKHFTVFSEGKITKAAEEKIEGYPPMKKLFVPVADMPAEVKELKSKSALASIFAQTAQKYNKK